MKALRHIKVILAVFIWVGTLNAASYPFDSGKDLSTLSQWQFYTRGIDLDLSNSIKSVPASFNLDNFYNYNDDSSGFYIHLPEAARPGLQSLWGFDHGRDVFGGPGMLRRISSIYRDRSYDYDLNRISTLAAISPDGKFGLGFDADSYNLGDIKLNIEKAMVPFPSRMLLLGTGLLGLFGLRKKEED